MKAGWSLREIGEAFQTVTGNTPPKSAAHFYGQDIPLVKPPELTDGDVSSASDGLTESGAAVARVAPEGSVLVSCIGNLGKIGLATRPLAFNQQINAIYPDPSLALPRFTFYQALSPQFREQLDALAAGTTVSIVNKSRFNLIKVHLPPLEEQRQIVAVLDEAFEGLARARAHAEANLQNARELFESFAVAAFSPRDETGEADFSTTLGAICDIQSGAGFPVRFQGETSGELPFYKVSDMNLPGNEWELHTANNYISEAVRSELRAKVFPQGSIVFPKVGGAIATNKKRIVETKGCVDNNVMGLIPNATKVVPAYLHEWLRAVDIYEFSNKANPPSITQATVSEWPIRVPSKEEQMRVVAQAEALRAETEALRQLYRNRTQNLDDLRQSLLQKAFAGELT